MNQSLLKVISAIILAASPHGANAFCGFYVAKADTKLFNRASQVVLARDGDKTVLTMANDYEGDPKEFAIVIPVPTFLEREQIRVSDRALIEHLDAYTAPRLVEYFDEDPCRPRVAYLMAVPARSGVGDGAADRAKALGVKIEAQYTIGEYDILILSAEQSDGLETWLKENGYSMPPGASKILASYIKQNMRFFVAKVNLTEQSKLGFTYLRPLQVSFESPKFMLPIRLGTVNADGPQELFIYTLSAKGRVETVNYRTVKLPTGMDVPLYVKDVFGDFYRALFAEQVRKENMSVVFLEYAWDMGWCDPCAADPLSPDELGKLGVSMPEGRVPAPAPANPQLRRVLPRPTNVYVTRMHLRYDAAHFPEDLVFQETGNRENFQGRYVLRHPWKGTTTCDAGKRYVEELPKRHRTEAENLAKLTGWDVDEIYRKASGQPGK